MQLVNIPAINFPGDIFTGPAERARANRVNHADHPDEFSPGKQEIHSGTENTAGKVLNGGQGIHVHQRNVPALVMMVRVVGSIRWITTLPSV